MTDVVANSAILRLNAHLEYLTEVLALDEKGQLRSGELGFADRVFDNAISQCVLDSDHAYSKMLFREALKSSFYDLQAARDEYLKLLSGQAPHAALLRRFLEVQTVLLAPLCPHVTQRMWEQLGHKGLVANGPFPEIKTVDATLKAQADLIRDFVVDHRGRIEQRLKKKGAVRPTTVTVVVAKTYPTWKHIILEHLASVFNDTDGTFPDNRTLQETFKARPELKTVMKNVRSEWFERRMCDC